MTTKKVHSLAETRRARLIGLRLANEFIQDEQHQREIDDIVDADDCAWFEAKHEALSKLDLANLPAVVGFLVKYHPVVAKLDAASQLVAATCFAGVLLSA